MHRKTPENLLRVHRRRAGLSQDELAFLFGVPSADRISRYESLTHQPRLDTVFAYEVVFGVPARHLFPGTFHEVEETTIKRVQLLLHKAGSVPPDATTARKLQALEAVAFGGISEPVREA